MARKRPLLYPLTPPPDTARHRQTPEIFLNLFSFLVYPGVPYVRKVYPSSKRLKTGEVHSSEFLLRRLKMVAASSKCRFEISVVKKDVEVDRLYSYGIDITSDGTATPQRRRQSANHHQPSTGANPLINYPSQQQHHTTHSKYQH